MSRNYWAISDTHFGHANILKWGRGEFPTVQEMDEHIIERWNSVVKPGDYVYHLGDVFCGPTSHEYKHNIMTRLAGKKSLIVGNHCDIPYLTKGGWFRKIQLWKHFHDFGLIMTHVPMHEDSIIGRAGDKAINVHGHTHLNGSPEGPYKSVCCELVNYTPVNLEDIRDGH